MVRGKSISNEIRSVIVSMNLEGYSQRKIAKTLKLSRSSVQSILRHVKKKKTIESTRKPGRPVTISHCDIRALKSVVIKNLRKVAKEITCLWNELTNKDVSVNTTKKYIKKIGFGFYKVR